MPICIFNTMKNYKMRLLMLTGLLLSAGMLPGQSGDTIDLFIQPDTDSRRISSVSLDSPQLGQAAPVMDEAKAALGWHYADFTDTISGYVQDEKIGKDLLPVEDAIIYSAPSTDSPVLGVYNFGENVEILDTGSWWTISVKMSFPVYFSMDSPAPLPAVTGEAEGALVAVDPAEAETREAILFEDQPIVDSTAGTGSSVPLAVESRERSVEPDVLGQSYHGTFRKSKRSFGLFKPKAPFYLEGSNGKRIAWMDTDNIVLPGSLNQFLDKTVIVHGARDYLSSSKDWIIRARNMRIK